MNLTFEEALKELETLVQKLEQGQVNLEEAVSFYEKGIQLKTYCEEKLRQARMRIEQLSLAEDGTIIKVPFGEDAV